MNQEMSARARKLYDELISKAQGDRSKEWFKQDMFPKFFEIKPEDYELSGNMETKTVLVRRAVAIDVMLKAMTDPKNSEKTTTAQIFDGDLLLGVLPMGSNGLGKVFPQFMTEDELRAGSITNRNTMSLFGHNTMNYEKLLSEGLESVIKKCNEKIIEYTESENAINNETERLETNAITDQESESSRKIYKNKTKKDFYTGVKIACQSVIDYAHRFAEIAEKESQKSGLSEERKQELLAMANIAKKVPEKPAESFHEAMQSITFFHIALHASMNFISLGRLDQVLKPYVENEPNKDRALEIMECFLIKLAGRLNLSNDYLVQQDHVDYATVLGTHSYYIDQKAGVNNFLQNIIVGGVRPEDGEDATNEATYLILTAIENVNLSTPGIYVRLHEKSPDALYEKVAQSIKKTRNNPSIINDDTMIKAMHDTLLQDTAKERANHVHASDERSKKMLELARDYCVDGCWELLLNCKCDWTFTMFNAMTALETSMNQGAKLSPEPELFRGAKIAPYVDMPTSFDGLMSAYESQLRFFVDQSALSMFLYYMIDEYAAPSPLFSAFLEGCMEKGRDKAWAGAEYNLAGIIFGGAPNVVNTLLGIQKWVFNENKYTLSQVADAFRNNFKSPDPTQRALQNIYTSIQIDIDTNTPKFGSDCKEVTELTRRVLDMFYAAVMDSAEFAKKVYQDKPEKTEWKNVIALRRLTGYYGSSLNKKFGDFSMKFTVGIGSFEQYNWQGRGIAACADRKSNEPLAPNFSAVPGTAYGDAVSMISSFKHYGLERFAGGVITDICLDDSDTLTVEVIKKLLKKAIADKSGMMTVSIGSEEIYREIYEKVIAANGMTDTDAKRKLLAPYAGVNVRIGGWQTPFITLPISHMENYIHRPSKI